MVVMYTTYMDWVTILNFFLYRLVTFLVVFMIALSLDHLVLLVLLLLYGISVESWCIHDGL